MLVSKVNLKLAKDTPDSLQAKIGEKQQQLAEVQNTIDILLDLAEQFGAASAGARLVVRESELRQLQTELQRLELQAEEGKLETTPGQVQAVLREMRGALTSKSVHDQRTMLAKVVVGMEMGPTGGTLTLTLPLSEVTGKCKVPPRDLERTPCRHLGGAESQWNELYHIQPEPQNCFGPHSCSLHLID